MQSVVSSEATAYEMQQQQTQVDHLLGLSYGGATGAGSQIQLKPWMQEAAGAGGIMDSFYAPLLSSSLVPGLEELHVKAEVAGAGDHQQKPAPPGSCRRRPRPTSTPTSSRPTRSWPPPPRP
jgi:hypothetical protein